jgi:hypothetical protein
VSEEERGQYSWLEELVGPLDKALHNAAATPNDLTDEHLMKCRAFADAYPEVGLIGLTRFVVTAVNDGAGHASAMATTVQLRDMSKRFDNESMTFTGVGMDFESALRAAFVDCAKARPYVHIRGRRPTTAA